MNKSLLNKNKIKFNETAKVKNWKPPEGVYLSRFSDFKQDERGSVILYFQIDEIKDSAYEYWVRNVYGPGHFRTMSTHLLNWLGEIEFKRMTQDGCYDLNPYLRRQVLVDVGLVKKEPYNEALRIINNLYPPVDDLDPLVGVGEFEI